MVGDRRLEKWLASVCKPFTKAKVKYFDRLEVDAAWKWLRETDEGDKATEEKDRKPVVADNSDMWNAFQRYGP